VAYGIGRNSTTRRTDRKTK